MNFFRCGGGGSSIKHDNVYIGNTTPTELVPLTIWLDTTNNDNVLKIYDGDKWIVVRGTWA